ncbi:MAG: hypothetical protein ABIO74_03795 [Dokdonella sp.]
MNIKVARLTTTALTGLCGLLLLLLVVQYAGVGRGYRWAEPASDAGAHVVGGAIDSKPVQMPPLSAFAEIDMHPLFNEDREPTPADASDGTPAPDANPLNVALTGVILDDNNHVRIAMLQDKSRNQAVALKVGMPLEGDQASWTLVELKPRRAIFRSAANETAEVELETTAAAVAPPHPPARGGGHPPIATPAARSVAGPNPNVQNNGADLAQRIEERRRQMREDAERLRKPDPSAPPKK